jgi:hypothetical protein
LVITNFIIPRHCEQNAVQRGNLLSSPQSSPPPSLRAKRSAARQSVPSTATVPATVIASETQCSAAICSYHRNRPHHRHCERNAVQRGNLFLPPQSSPPPSLRAKRSVARQPVELTTIVLITVIASETQCSAAICSLHRNRPHQRPHHSSLRAKRSAARCHCEEERRGNLLTAIVLVTTLIV